MRRSPGVLLVAALLAGCDGDPPPAPIVRPVLSVVAEPADHRKLGFAGLIEPRYQTDRAFQVLGRIITRDVDVGDLVKTGQTIATNDPLTYQLAVRSAQSELVTANSQLEKTTAQKGRTQALVKQGVSSQADLDGAQQALDAAAASVQQAQARLAKAKEQLGYTTLTADLDGVVTGVYAQIGQMASPGMRVMTLARTDIREAVVDVPDDIARALKPGAPFRVTLQADPSVGSLGKVREISPEADAATRLRRIKVTLDEPQEAFRLGATITASPELPMGGPSIELPRTALFERDGAGRVWLVDKDGKTVRSVAVEVAYRDDRTIRLSAGVPPGERVVIAGANSLSEGQAVRTGDGK
jgi:RND family efflux transporter MFP subunit